MSMRAADGVHRRPSPGAALNVAIFATYLAYLFGICAFSKRFARLGVEVFGIPLFAGEAAIALLSLLLVARTVLQRKVPFPVDNVTKALGGYFLIGSAFAAVGLLRGYGIATFRDFALVYYLVFFVFTLAVVGLGLRPRTIVSLLAVASVLGSIVTIASFLIAPRLTHEHGAPGYQALAAWLAAVWCCLSFGEASRPLTRGLLAGATAICIFIIYLAAYRTLLPVMVSSVAVLWAWALAGRSGREGPIFQAAGLTTVALAVFGAAVVGHNLTMVAPDRPLPGHGPIALTDSFKVLSYRWVRGFRLLAPTVVQVAESSPEDATTQVAESSPQDATTGAAVEGSLAWRAAVWGRALEKIRSSPLLGIGYGPPPGLHPDPHCELPSSPTSNCGNAHNTYLTLAMRMGIPVFLFFAAINLRVVADFLKRSFRQPSAARTCLLPPFLATAYLAFLTYALTSLFFESPYLSSLYWVVLGLMHATETSSSQPGRRPGASEGGAPVSESPRDSGDSP